MKTETPPGPPVSQTPPERAFAPYSTTYPASHEAGYLFMPEETEHTPAWEQALDKRLIESINDAERTPEPTQEEIEELGKQFDREMLSRETLFSQPEKIHTPLDDYPHLQGELQTALEHAHNLEEEIAHLEEEYGVTSHTLEARQATQAKIEEITHLTTAVEQTLKPQPEEHAPKQPEQEDTPDDTPPTSLDEQEIPQELHTPKPNEFTQPQEEHLPDQEREIAISPILNGNGLMHSSPEEQVNVHRQEYSRLRALTELNNETKTYPSQFNRDVTYTYSKSEELPPKHFLASMLSMQRDNLKIAEIMTDAHENEESNPMKAFSREVQEEFGREHVTVDLHLPSGERLERWRPGVVTKVAIKEGVIEISFEWDEETKKAHADQLVDSIS